MPMNRHHDSQRSDRLVTQPSRPTPPPPPPPPSTTPYIINN